MDDGALSSYGEFIVVRMTELQRRIARARLLRRQGKTYDEIRAVVGAVSDDRLATWLAGIPRPRQTRRGRSRDDLRRECRRLRAQGMTYAEIAERTGASPGSISPWVRDVRRPEPTRGEERRRAGVRDAARERSALASRRREFEERVARASIGPLADRELFLVGVALYWAEGSKSKPYQVRERITFINSDPTVMAVFLRWLDLLGVPAADRRYRVSIHETADIPAAVSFWARVVGVPESMFSRTTIKRHRPMTNRLNVGTDYRGCLVVTLLGSAALYRAVAGWWAGAHTQITRDPRRGSEWSDAPWRNWAAFRRRFDNVFPGCSVGRGDDTLNVGTT